MNEKLDSYPNFIRVTLARLSDQSLRSVEYSIGMAGGFELDGKLRNLAKSNAPTDCECKILHN